MISFTIDVSVFALPPKNNDPLIEYENIRIFITNMLHLQYLEKRPSVTVSYINNISKKLFKNKTISLFTSDLTVRIQNLNKPGIINNRIILDFFRKKCKEISLKKDNKTRKLIRGKVGIYENILSKNADADPERKYKNISYDKNIYPNEFKKQLSSVFEIYLGFLAELNKKYSSKNSNYILISGDKDNAMEKITLCYDQFNQSEVNVLGIHKASGLYHINKLLDSSNILAKIQKFNNLILGQQITQANIVDGISFNDCNEEKDYFNKIYYYLDTLNNITNIVNSNIALNNDNELVFLLNSHGCFCSPDYDNYKKCPAKFRHLKDSNGVDEYFTLHLKPITYNKKFSDLTRRIYFKLEKSKILIGWIGKHLQSCSDCGITNCSFWRPPIRLPKI